MLRQISFPLETELAASDSCQPWQEIKICLEVNERLSVQDIRQNDAGTYDIYLGDFVSIYNVPGNFTVTEEKA